MELILQEYSAYGYKDRTLYNINKSDFTFAFAIDFDSAGEVLTKKHAMPYYKAYKLNDKTQLSDLSIDIYDTIKKNDIKVLNIAGNSVTTWHKMGLSQRFVNKALFDIFSPVHKHLGLTMIRSGGQTGTDLSAAVIAKALDIDATITFPRNFRQRNIHGKDFNNNKETLEKMIIFYANELLKTKE